MAGKKKAKVPTRRRAKWLGTQTEKVLRAKRGKGSYVRKEEKEKVKERLEEEIPGSPAPG
ncbi:MAG: hypothetical protein QF662_06710 [Phycisphaerae bacterium]|jgi:DNA-binding transcriptional regulator YhcF (GntR family)|nr:hypothetical protein [Phycisphaerae bacterium]